MPLRGHMVIGQSGGPTAVINQSLAAAVLEAKRHRAIREIWGARNGMAGIQKGEFVDLRKEPAAVWKAVARTPAAALGSARKKPSPEECVRAVEIFRRHEVRYFFYIGGNDSAESAHLIQQEAARSGYEMACYHIPKTIDNDLLENDHTPGYGSAARFVACAVMGDTLDCRSLPGVKIDVIMGRHAGFLTAAAALARRHPDDGPHLIYLPERPFSPERFAASVEAVVQQFGFAVVAVSEGIADEKGQPIAAGFTGEKDSHGNVQLSGTGALGDWLAAELRRRTSITRVRADTFGYLQRSFPAVVSETDAREAWQAGAVAVRLAVQRGDSGTVALVRRTGPRYGVQFERRELHQVARATRSMPDDFIAPSGHDVTEAFLEYARPLIGPLPVPGRLRMKPVSLTP